MRKETILVTGALGQIGTELTCALREKCGRDSVIATDRLVSTEGRQNLGPYFQLDVMDKYELHKLVCSLGVTQIYHLAAMLSASGELEPMQSWELNMQGLLNVLHVARLEKLDKVFWPSSIAVFGKSSPDTFCPQNAVTEPGTVYGISKHAGELWCQYYFEKYGLDIRSLRYPGLISHTAKPGGGTTDYSVDMFHKAVADGHYTCYLTEGTLLPMLYMPDAIRAALELMDTPAEKLSVRTSYNLWGLTFSPKDLAKQIQQYLPDFTIDYAPDFRQEIADSWPSSINGHAGFKDWGWKHQFFLPDMVADMLYHLGDADLKKSVDTISATLGKEYLADHVN